MTQQAFWAKQLLYKGPRKGFVIPGCGMTSNVSSNTRKRAASPNIQGPISKRLRSSTQKTPTTPSQSNTSVSRPHPKPRMRPKRPLSPGDEPIPEFPKSKKPTPKSGLKIATIGKPEASTSRGKGKAKAVQFVESESEYGEDEVDELEGDTNDDEVDAASSGSDTPPAPPVVKKLKIRVGSTSKTASDKKQDSHREANELQIAKIAFVAQKKDIRSRPVHIEPDIDFDLFIFHVAKAFGAVAGEQDLVWKTDRMAKSDKNWHELKNEEDLEMVMAMGVSTLEEELKKAEVVVAKNEEAEKKCLAKGKPFFPKSIPALADFLIILRDHNSENKGKETKQEKKSTKKVATAGALENIGEKILWCIDKIKARKCTLCKKSCAVLPGKGTAEPDHHKLSDSEIQIWAQQAAKRGDTSFEEVPKELMMQLMDHKPKPRGTKKGASASNQLDVPPLENPIPPLAPAPPHHGHPYHPPPPVNPHYGYYPPYPPPYPPYGYPGLETGMDGFV
ncbi:hypothetical protein FRC09_016061 [Ceratobasidium sp. 395]|nr:hypothetical protein FRC09_016061 [Ceratobasidium sp. 395]